MAMNKKNKIAAILNIAANKKGYHELEFIERNGNRQEIRREVVKIPSTGASTTLTIGLRTESYDTVKNNLLELVKTLQE